MDGDYSAAFRPFVDFDEVGVPGGGAASSSSFAPPGATTTLPDPARSSFGALGASTSVAVGASPSLLSRVPLLAWVLLGCVLLFAVSFYVYYTRRKSTTLNREAEEIEGLRKQLAEAREDIDALIQQHTAMAGSLRATTSQLRGVNELARGVEQGLAEALDSWSQTVQELRSEFEVVAVEEEDLTAAHHHHNHHASRESSFAPLEAPATEHDEEDRTDAPLGPPASGETEQ